MNGTNLVISGISVSKSIGETVGLQAAGSQVLKRGDQATCSRNVPKGVQELYSKTHVQDTNKVLDKCFKKELYYPQETQE